MIPVINDQVKLGTSLNHLYDSRVLFCFVLLYSAFMDLFKKILEH